jgi:hypothetical protein
MPEGYWTQKVLEMALGDTVKVVAAAKEHAEADEQWLKKVEAQLTIVAQKSKAAQEEALVSEQQADEAQKKLKRLQSSAKRCWAKPDKGQVKP